MNSKGIPVWFTAGYSNLYHAQNDLRAGDAAGQFKIVASHPHPDFVGLTAADIAIREPACSGAAFLAFVRRVVRELGVQVLIPSRNQGLLHTYKAQLAKEGVTVATVASASTLRLINDKAALYRFLEPQALVRIPAFATARTGRELALAAESLGAQGQTVCMKPTRGVYGSGFRILSHRPDTVTDLVNESMRLSLKNVLERAGTRAIPEMLVMQYLEGTERSVDCLAYEGRLLGGVIRKKSPHGGDAQVIENNPELMTQVSALTRALGLNGLFNVQFKDTNNMPHLLEINTRMSGRSYYATLAGMNLPYLAALLFSGSTSPDDVAEAANRNVAFGMRIANVNVGVPLPATPAWQRPATSNRESA